MEQVRISGIEIDRCRRCQGIWFDPHEQKELQEACGAHKADIGHQAIGEYYNSMRDISCPRCRVVMQPEEEQRGRIRIQYEACPSCHGSYFDAGEFRSFAEPTLLEFAREMIRQLSRRISRRS